MNNLLDLPIENVEDSEQLKELTPCVKLHHSDEIPEDLSEVIAYDGINQQWISGKFEKLGRVKKDLKIFVGIDRYNNSFKFTVDFSRILFWFYAGGEYEN